MNSIDLNPNYSDLYSHLVSVFEKTGYFNYGHHDETLCSMQVYETAKELIKRHDQPVHEQIILVAAILHDIGKSKLNINTIVNLSNEDSMRKAEWTKHIKLSIPLAKDILLSKGHSIEFIGQVCYLVGNHDKSHDNLINRSIELQILQDADIVADCGIVDLLRCFSFGAIYKRQMIGSIKYLSTQSNRIDEDGKLNLKISQILAKEKMVLYNLIMVELNKMIDSDLINHS